MALLEKTARAFRDRVVVLGEKVTMGPILFMQNHGFPWDPEDNWKAELDALNELLDPKPIELDPTPER